ncbi:MAG: acyl carrier protein [Planctomycetes bacterium]|nr:acyl carrier protein [Planctomycetota bacterium]
MNTHEVETTVTDILRTLFRQPTLEARDDLTARDVTGWDSLNHVNLIIQVEEEFGIRFSNDEVANFVNVGELKRLIRQKVGITADESTAEAATT